MHDLQFGPSKPQPTGDELADARYAREMERSIKPIARALGLCPEHWDDLVKNAEGTLDCPSCMREDFYEDKQ
jgi:hypothetical protein